MGNMSYCRFENTLEDLRDCHDNFDNTVSKDEGKARQRLYKICQSIVDNFDIDILNEDCIEED